MKLLKIITNRVFLVGVLLLIQLLLIVGILWQFQEYFVYFYAVYVIAALFAILSIINSRRNPAYKIAWLIPVMLLPYIGVVIYFIFGHLYVRSDFVNRMRKVQVAETRAIEQTVEKVTLPENDMDAIIQSNYLTNYGLVPLFKNTKSQYLPLGEDMFESMKIELEKAEQYIFMEYFIIEKGKMWDEILEILVRKAEQGVDVRLMYDDFGCMFTLPHRYDLELEKMGIKSCVFNPFVPVLSSIFNNRNHRKITVIDGKVAFTGGANLADEYINQIDRFGHWKDTAIRLEGEAAWGFTLMFLTLWDFVRGENDVYEDYHPGHFPELSDDEGFYQPYTDIPFDEESLSSNVYLSLINRADHYVYITTPYLIIDNLLMEALCNAAKSGVDVRIQTPYIPDKWYVHAVTRSNYDQLIEAGVKIYEYTPGFIHSKTFVVDNEYAVVGSINMDYRSLYLHIECGVWMYKTTAVQEVYDDFIATQALCQEITLDEVRRVGWWRHLGRAVLNVFAPLM